MPPPRLRLFSTRRNDGTFEQAVVVPAITNVVRIAIADFNADGALDLVAKLHSGTTAYIGAGDGTFQPGTDYHAPFGAEEIAVADVNGDFTPDVVVLARPTIWIHRGNGDGTLAPQAIGFSTLPRATEFSIVDVNRDGRRDLVVSGSIADEDGPPFGALGILTNTTPPQ